LHGELDVIDAVIGCKLGQVPVKAGGGDGDEVVTDVMGMSVGGRLLIRG